MISFNFETPFTLNNSKEIEKWVESIIVNNGFSVGEINYIFCDDE